MLATHMVRYPLGGNLSWALQYILGLQRAGADLTIVERADYPNACFDPLANQLTDDPASGLQIVRDLLARHGLADRFVFVDHSGRYHGLDGPTVHQRFADADCFIDSGNHGAWSEPASQIPCRVLIDGEPGYTQIRCVTEPARKAMIDQYNFHFSNGLLLDTEHTAAPPTGHRWRPFVNPVCPDLFEHVPPPPDDAHWSTIMNWQAHKPLEYQGKVYGQKDLSFERFKSLPQSIHAAMELAVSGQAPRDELAAMGWRIADAKAKTRTVDGYYQYIRESLGEFSVAKHVFVEARTGWFSDRSAAYLASGRPVILQDTGFSEVLPTGEGLFAVNNIDEAREAIESVQSDYSRHSHAAREVARECLDAGKAFADLLASVK
ncbi:hypothetical protein HED60_18265 [Planctomycetales bacterium ZRK34]|nr:hypothetical protein HED60_18265 [Planctomycetales bacterium ZRK34]